MWWIIGGHAHEFFIAVFVMATPTAAQVPTGQSWDSILDALCQAYTADQSGMVFWETARSFRADRVFEEEYFDWLFHRIRYDLG